MYLINTPEISDLEKYQLLSMELQGSPNFRLKQKNTLGKNRKWKEETGKKIKYIYSIKPLCT